MYTVIKMSDSQTFYIRFSNNQQQAWLFIGVMRQTGSQIVGVANIYQNKSITHNRRVSALTQQYSYLTRAAVTKKEGGWFCFYYLHIY